MRLVPAEFAKGNRLLLATDAAAEGLNLQHRCRVVIHYELPWNPARLEQRAGRVDRIGQARRVHELALVANTSAERLVLAPLLKHGARGGDIERSRSLAGLTESRVADAIVRRVALEVPRAWSATEPPCVTKPPELIARIAAAEAERLGRARILLHRSAAPAPLPPRPPIVITRPRRAKRRAVERLNLLYAIHLETPAGRFRHSEIVPLAIRLRDPTEAGARRLKDLVERLNQSGEDAAVASVLRPRITELLAVVADEIGCREAQLRQRIAAITAHQRAASVALAQPRLFGRRRAHEPDEYRRPDDVMQLPDSELPLTVKIELIAVTARPAACGDA